MSLADLTAQLARCETERGRSARILGNPLLAAIALANAQPLPAGRLKRGQIVTTGTCTIPIPPRPDQYVGDFGALGTLRLDIVLRRRSRFRMVTQPLVPAKAGTQCNY